MAGTKGKVAAEKIQYSVTETITVSVSMTRELIPFMESEPMYFWSWSILVEGRERFKGADLITRHNKPHVAALDVLFGLCPSDGKVPDWFKGEANASQANWFKITGPRMAPIVGRISTIGQYPGAHIITDNGLIPFTKDGIAMNTMVAPIEDESVLGERSAGTQQLIDAQMDYVDPEDETPPTYGNNAVSNIFSN